MLNLRGHKCLIVGGGAVAVRRAHALAAAGCRLITVVAPYIDSALRELNVTIHERPYRETDLVDMRLVVLATDDSYVNERIARHAAALGVLINRSDDAARSEISFMAQAHVGAVTLAAHTSVTMPDAARTIVKEMRASLKSHWPAVIEIAAPFRQKMKQTISDPMRRRASIRMLIDESAVAVFNSQGPSAYSAYCEALCQSQTLTTDKTAASDIAAISATGRESHIAFDVEDDDDSTIGIQTPA